jgi:hypothetical protein
MTAEYPLFVAASSLGVSRHWKKSALFFQALENKDRSYIAFRVVGATENEKEASGFDHAGPVFCFDATTGIR